MLTPVRPERVDFSSLKKKVISGLFKVHWLMFNTCFGNSTIKGKESNNALLIAFVLINCTRTITTNC